MYDTQCPSNLNVIQLGCLRHFTNLQSAKPVYHKQNTGKCTPSWDTSTISQTRSISMNETGISGC